MYNLHYLQYDQKKKILRKKQQHNTDDKFEMFHYVFTSILAVYTYYYFKDAVSNQCCRLKVIVQ